MSDFFVNIDWSEILQASLDTFWMLGGSLLFTVILGLPLGVLLFLTGPRLMFQNRAVYALLSFVVNVLRSLPFIILLIVMIPFTVLVTGTSLGVAGAIPPLVVGATPFFARLVETALREVDKGIIEATQAMGASTRQIIWNALLPDVSVAPPAAYAVPAPWTAVIDRLAAHGVVMHRLAHAVTVQADGYQLDDPAWAAAPFEGHHMLTGMTVTPVRRTVTLPPGSAIVPMDQRAANVAIELLEPQAPDSLLRWGYLDAVFEPKEYGEPRVLEQLARDMMAKDPALQAAFRKRLATDAAFAADPRARLEWFFRRSPWYAAQAVGAYPVLRLDPGQLAGALRGAP